MGTVDANAEAEEEKEYVCVRMMDEGVEGWMGWSHSPPSSLTYRSNYRAGQTKSEDRATD